jgi:2-polyprenyl-6-methoxyphenol hydroxylase-like FAD-dependent oxidoreductase
MIVGAGPTGLMLACDLQRRGIPFHIVDRSDAPSNLSRAVGLQARTLETFDDLGLVEEFLAMGVVVKAVRSYNRGRLHHVFELDTSPRGDIPYPYLLVVEQHVTESILLGHLTRQGGTVHRGAEIKRLVAEPDQVQSLLRTVTGERQVRSSYLIGCDGPHSSVRRLRGIGFPSGGSDLLYNVADVELRWAMPPQEIIWLVDGETEVVAIPLPGNGRYRLNHWRSRSSSSAEPGFGALEAPLDVDSWRGIMDRLASGDVNLTKVRASLAYRTGHGLADAFQLGRTFLAGDAAHALPQCTAQGLNLGLQDAYNLGWKLGLVINGDAPQAFLETYQRERRPVAQAALSSVFSDPALMGRATHLESREALDQWSQLNLDYRHSLEAPSSLAGAIAQAGDRAPDGVLAREGTSVYLYDLLKGLHYHLLIFSDFEDSDLDELVLELESRQYTALEILRVGLACDALLDRDSRLHRAYAAGHGALILIRPDRFIAARATLSDSSELLSYLSEHLTPSGSFSIAGERARKGCRFEGYPRR